MSGGAMTAYSMPPRIDSHRATVAWSRNDRLSTVGSPSNLADNSSLPLIIESHDTCVTSSESGRMLHVFYVF